MSITAKMALVSLSFIGITSLSSQIVTILQRIDNVKSFPAQLEIPSVQKRVRRVEARIVLGQHRTICVRRLHGVALGLMLRIFVLQNLYDLADEKAVAEVIDSRAFSDFCGVDSSNQVPNGDALGRFRNLLIQNGIQGLLFAQVVELLAKRGLILKKGTMVDSTIIEAPSSTKNREYELHKALLRKHSIVDCVEKPKGGDNMSIQVIPPTGRLIDRHRQENALADLSVMEKMLEQQLKSNEETAEAMRENNELLRSIADALKA